jgi:hypothetical protein
MEKYGLYTAVRDERRYVNESHFVLILSDHLPSGCHERVRMRVDVNEAKCTVVRD